MKIVMAAACSKDGFIARRQNEDVASWTSAEDKVHLRKLIAAFPVLLMGSRTFDLYSQPDNSKKLRVIFTRDMKRLKAPKQTNLQYVSMTPHEFVEEYASYGSALLLGGSSLYQQFIQAQLVDELFLTVEPITFNQGIPLLAGSDTIETLSTLSAVETQTLNNAGTELRHYILKK